MAQITPTKQRVRWGPEAWQLFDYFAHPIRDNGGNPCFIWRHGGGGSGGHFEESWLDTVPWFSFFNFLNKRERDVHFDIISIETGQRSHNRSPGGLGLPINFRRSKMLFFPEALADFKRGVASVKRWGQAVNGDAGFFINPNKCIVGGQSFGASIAGISCVTAPLVLGADGDTRLENIWEPTAYDSTALGCFYMMGQIDARNTGTGGVTYHWFKTWPGWYGTRGDIGGGTSAEWDALPATIKASMSLRAYFERIGGVQHYCPFYVLYEANTGAHTFPLEDAHDSIQSGHLVKAIAEAKDLAGRGLTYGVDTITDASNLMVEQNNVHAYNWMAALVKAGYPRVGGAIR